MADPVVVGSVIRGGLAIVGGILGGQKGKRWTPGWPAVAAILTGRAPATPPPPPPPTMPPPSIPPPIVGGPYPQLPPQLPGGEIQPGRALPEPFYPPVPYKEPKKAKAKKPKPKPRPRKPGSGVLKDVGRGGLWGIGTEIVRQVMLGTEAGMTGDAERQAEESRERADRADEALKERERELRQVELDAKREEAAQRRLDEREAKRIAREEELRDLRLEGQWGRVITKSQKAADKAVQKAIKESQKAAGPQAVANIPVPDEPLMSLPSFPQVPAWLNRALVLGPLVGLLPSSRSSSSRSSQLGITPLAPELPELDTSLYTPDFLSLSAATGGQSSTATEVCSCRPRYPKRRRKPKGERRICYTRKVKA